MSADDYLALGETPERYELVNGIVLLSPGPDPGEEESLHGLIMTADEYLGLGRTRASYELIDSLVVGWSPQTPRHSRVLCAIAGQFTMLEASGAPFAVVPWTNVRLSAKTVLRPDLPVFNHRPGWTPPDRLTEPPDLVVEVSSSETAAYDLTTKLEDYDRFEVGEYWVVDADTLDVRTWTRPAGPLMESPAPRGGVVATAVPGLRLDLDQLRRIIGPGC